MPTSYSYVQAFSQKFSDPDLFDAVDATVNGVDQFFAEIGKIAKAAQAGTLTTGEAQWVKANLQKFSDGVNRLNARIAGLGAVPGGTEDARFAQAFKSLIASVNFGIQEVTYAADEVIAGNPSSLPKLSASASGLVKNVGGLFGLAQIGAEFYDKGLTAHGVDGAGEKALGVLVGMVGAEVAATFAAGLAAVVGAPIIVSAGAAIGAAVLVGYGAGKAGEALWEPSRWWFESEFLPSVFDQWTQAYATMTAFLGDLAVDMGQFDGTWLEGLDASDEQKAAFTTLLAGVSQLPASAAMNADIERLLTAPFDGSTLVSRDALIKAVLLVAKEQHAYASERVTVTDGAVTLSLSGVAGQRAMLDLREVARNSLSAFDQRGFAIIAADRVVVSPQAGTLAGGNGNDLLVGSTGVDGLIGNAGNDELVAGAGQDILLGQQGADVLFGGNDDDWLDGGDNCDSLYGGQGTDTYNFAGSFGGDAIVDSDGLGSIVVDGQAVTGSASKKTGNGTYTDGTWLYALVPDGNGNNNLVLRRDSSLNIITVRGWTNGQLGITLSETPADPPRLPTPTAATTSSSSRPATRPATSSTPSATMPTPAPNRARRICSTAAWATT